MNFCRKHVLSIIFMLLAIFIYSSSYSQYCTPISDCSSDDYIDNFTLNTISNLNSGGSNCNNTSYINTGLSTTVYRSSTYSISVEGGNQSFPQGYGIWIDFNQDNDFDDANEFVSQSPNYSTIIFNDFITIPSSANLGATRMRVRSTAYNTFSSTESCSNVWRGESEDYTINISVLSPPTANFSPNGTSLCSDSVNFLDLSGLSPTNWIWDFGDGDSSFVQNPVHVYSNDGVYTVTLIVSNNSGSDTLSGNLNINTSGSGITPSCMPSTFNNCCGFGIINVTLNTLNSSTADGSVGYEDLSCQLGTTVTEGQSYSISINTSGSNPGENNIRAWIDFNNDGILNNISELVFAADNALIASGSIYIPTGTALNTPLRLRISNDYNFEPIPSPCSDLIRGQAEDYSITILGNTNPPIANFSANNTTSCTGLVSFSDISENAPTYWLWDFGDGNTSNMQNPSHSYSQNGTYTVSLFVANSFGGDTLIYNNYITVDLNAGPKPNSCIPNTLGNCCGYGIYNVDIANISNYTSGGEEGYKDFSCSQQTPLEVGQFYNISILTGTSNPQDTRVWIDFDNNGVFNDVTEKVYSADNTYNPSGIIYIPTTTARDTLLRMRITSDFAGSLPTPCYEPWYGQTEDYGVIIGLPPIADFTITDTLICENTCINFTDLTTQNPTAWLWSFPGASQTTSSDQNPSNICYSNSGIYNISLTAINPFGSDIETKSGYITVISCPPPIANFTTNITSICNNECISFEDQTTNNPSSWSWSFPGASPSNSNDKNPSNICYYDTGSFDVTLIATNTTSSDTVTFTNYITVNNCIPTTIFSSNDTAICETECIDFSDLSINNPTSWTWLFPGAQPDTSSSQNPNNICYQDSGSFDVTLISSNVSGSDTLQLTNYIYVNSCLAPYANFSISDSSICKGDCINLTDQSSDASSFLWVLSGANPDTSLDQSPQNICYPNSGSFTITCIVNNPLGSDTLSKSIFVQELNADFILDDTLYTNQLYPYIDVSTGNPTIWNWNFGDGIFENSQNPQHAFNDTGYYYVQLIVSNDSGCIDSITQSVYVQNFVGYFPSISISNIAVIYPNPTKDIFYISFDYAPIRSSMKLSLKDISGRTVLSKNYHYIQNTNTIEVGVKDFPTGMYLLELEMGNNKFIDKLILH